MWNLLEKKYLKIFFCYWKEKVKTCAYVKKKYAKEIVLNVYNFLKERRNNLHTETAVLSEVASPKISRSIAMNGIHDRRKQSDSGYFKTIKEYEADAVRRKVIF